MVFQIQEIILILVEKVLVFNVVKMGIGKLNKKDRYTYYL